jgi:DNA damage-inducible protein 1
VLENDDVDFLFGLDMLKRHQCCIDLRRNLLVLGSAGKEVPFLAEKDLPARARGHQEEGAEGGGEGGREGERTGGEGREAGLEGQLIGLGFSREQARSGLRRTEGNVEEAAALLLAEFGEREGGS